MSQDLFQMKIAVIVEKWPGTTTIHNHVAVYGKAREDHDANLLDPMTVAAMNGLVLNPSKFEIKKSSTTSFGCQFTNIGIKLIDLKSKEIKHASIQWYNDTTIIIGNMQNSPTIHTMFHHSHPENLHSETESLSLELIHQQNISKHQDSDL